ncbi:FixH family protein [Elstera cyanobacteriorum]|nr:FixH family protein [Elstera cyanobacteriorum]MCK6444600.1 FixH family protein [Elstera cyanobacteriorum]GGA00529.1 hypothetical protein GCM10011497_34000 [Elstera cyanobacteriorum]
MTTLPAADLSRRSRWIPWVFVVGFLTVLIPNGFLLYYSTRQPVGLVVEKPYERGIAYNKLLAAAREQAKLGWQAQTTVSGFDAAKGTGRVVIAVTDATGPLADAVVQLTLSRPLEGDSLPVLTLPVEGGTAQATVTGLRPGQWEARMVVRRGTDHAVLDQRLIVR